MIENYLDQLKLIKNTELFKDLFKKINYKKVQNYEDSRNIALNLASEIILEDQKLINNNNILHYNLITAAKSILKNENTIPFYYLNNTLFKDLIETEIPENWQNLKPFSNEGIFMLPLNHLEYQGFKRKEYLNWIYFCYINPENFSNNFQNIVLQKYKTINTKPFIIWVGCSNEFSVFGSSIDLMDSVNYLNTNIEDSEAKNFIIKVSKLVLNIFLLMYQEPKYLELGYKKSKYKNKLPQSSKSKNPNWIGNNYLSLIPQNKIKSFNNYRTVIPHLRKGHWARRRHGKKQNWYYQLHWIQPTLVNYLSEFEEE